MLLCLLTPAPNVSSGGLPGSSGFGKRQWFCPQGAVLQAPKECQSFTSVLHRVTQVLPVVGEAVLFWRDAGKHSPAQGWVTACRVQGCHRPLPPGLRPHRSPALGRRGVVLTGAALWYLKRGYPLYVHFINGEYTGGDSYLRIKL